MSNDSGRNPHPPPPGGEGPGPFAFIGDNATPASPIASPPVGQGPAPVAVRDLAALPTTPDPAVAAELALLQQIRDGVRGGAQNIAITEEAVPPMLTQGFPVPGAERWLISREPTGGVVALPEGQINQVLAANRARIGGSLVNEGKVDVRLFLVDVNTARSGSAGRGTLWLGRNGGTWDFRLGTLLWGGSICALPIEGASSIAVVEV